MNIVRIIAGWSVVAALTLTAAFASSAGTVTALWVLAVAALFTLAFVVILAPAAALTLVTSINATPDIRARHAHGWSLAGLVAGLYFARIERAHQILGNGRHLSALGAVDLVLLATGAIIIWRACLRPDPRWRKVLHVVAVALAFHTIAALEDPPSDRSSAAAAFPLAATDPASNGSANPRRVLFLGIDGLDWRILSSLAQSGELPQLQKVISRGDRWSLNNAGLRRSPEIWTALQTSTRPQLNGVGGFSQWMVFGEAAVIVARPYFGPHVPFLIEHVLAVMPAWVWDLRLTTAEDIRQPTFWELAAEAGRSTAVVAPFPMTSPLLAINGVMAVRDAQRRRWEVAHTVNGRTVRSTRPFLTATPAGDEPELNLLHNERVALAERFFAEQHPDVGVFYTSRIDEVMHLHWRNDCDFLGECAVTMGSLTSTPIGDAYRIVDRDIGRLITAFGEPAMVVLVSDHGWELGEYAHSLSPDGVLVVSPAPAATFRGRTDIYRVTPTILEFLGISPEANMTPLNLAGQSLVPRPARRFPFPQKLAPAAMPSAERLELLRGVGYIAR